MSEATADTINVREMAYPAIRFPKLLVRFFLGITTKPAIALMPYSSKENSTGFNILRGKSDATIYKTVFLELTNVKICLFPRIIKILRVK